MLGVDFGSTASKILRVKKEKSGLTVAGVQLLPVLTLSGNGQRPPEEIELLRGLPKIYRSNYAAMAVSSGRAVVRLLSLPGQIQGSKAVEAHLREHAGLEGEYRLAYTATSTKSTARGRQETKFLAVALPEEEAKAVLSLVPSGPPAPWSIELAGLGALNAFLHGPGNENRDQAVGVIEAGARVAYLALFNKGALVLVRKFDFGCETLVSRVQQQMGVERDVAEGIIADGSFDISSCVHDVMGPFLRQLSISRDFVERQEKCRINRLYLSGGMALSNYWIEEIKSRAKMDVVLWNPFDAVQVAPGAYPDELRGQETRFTAALGVAMGAFDYS